MAVHIVIKRKVKQGRQAKELVPFLLKMRILAMHQPGYISGETLCDIERPGDCVVISSWERVEDWNTWYNSPERKRMEQQIENLTGEKAECHIYSPMVLGSIADVSTTSKAERKVSCS